MRAACAGVLLALGSCGFSADRPGDAAVAGLDVSREAAPFDGAGYHATAVRFQSSGNDYIWTNALANTVDSPRGTLSGWFRFTAGDGQQQQLSVGQVVAIGGVFRTGNNHVRFLLFTCAGGVLLDMQTQQTYKTTNGWVHLLASWDVAAGRADLYVNDVLDREGNPNINSGNVCYASLKWGIGGVASGQVDADLADIYAALGTYLDLSVEANRRRFSDSSGKPIDLGANCMGPTGAIPTGCFTGDLATWHTNKGIAGGFNIEGDGLAAAPTSPSD
jgi:hypothetical protein